MSKIRVSEIRVSEIRVSEIRVSEIRGSEIRGSEIRTSSNHRELHGAIFFLSRVESPKLMWILRRGLPQHILTRSWFHPSYP